MELLCDSNQNGISSTQFLDIVEFWLNYTWVYKSSLVWAKNKTYPSNFYPGFSSSAPSTWRASGWSTLSPSSSRSSTASGKSTRSPPRQDPQLVFYQIGSYTEVTLVSKYYIISYLPVRSRYPPSAPWPTTLSTSWSPPSTRYWRRTPAPSWRGKSTNLTSKL